MASSRPRVSDRTGVYLLISDPRGPSSEGGDSFIRKSVNTYSVVSLILGDITKTENMGSAPRELMGQ